LFAEDVEAEEGDKHCLDHSFDHPHEVVFVVEDAVLLPDEVDLGEEAVEVFVDAVTVRQVVLLLNKTFPS
jgi:hypothetical protein